MSDQATKAVIKIGGEDVSNESISVSVNMVLNQPDMCVVVLGNEAQDVSTKYDFADPVEVTIGDDDTVVFKGELVAIEPTYTSGGNNTCVIRAYNRLHRLLRGRNSKTYVKQSDQDIASAIAGQHGLSAKCGSSPKMKHEHVYQHNQTDLEFLRLRAARLGFEVWVNDRDLYFDAPQKDKDSGLKVQYGKADSEERDDDANQLFLKYFAPRMSSANVVAEVTVRGWDPEKKTEIVGKATTSRSSKLGSKSGSDASSGFGNSKVYEVDTPIFSVEEAKAIAEARLDAHNMSFVTGEGECRGNAKLKPGIVITVTVNVNKADHPFNGKYLLTGVTHNYKNSSRGGEEGGYTTSFRVARDAKSP